MYAQDYDETTVYSVGQVNCWIPAGGTVTTCPPWYVSFTPYIKNTQLYACPSANIPAWCANSSLKCYNVGRAISANLVPSTFTVHYGGNDSMMAWWNRRLASIVAPSRLLVFADANRVVDQDGAVAYANPTFCNPQPNAGTDKDTRHNGGSNIAYADGHVKWANASSICNGQAYTRDPNAQ